MSRSSMRILEEDLERLFRQSDADGDGKISAEELRAMMERLVSPREDAVRQAEKMMGLADTDGDGFISLAEFVAFNTEGVDEEADLRALREAFKIYDADGDGSISPEELQGVLRSLGEPASIEQCRTMIQKVDRDGDGVVSFEEFKVMIRGGSSDA